MALHGTSCPGVGVLPSPETPADLVYEPENLVVMFGFWRELYEFVILDTPDRTENWDCHWPTCATSYSW